MCGRFLDFRLGGLAFVGGVLGLGGRFMIGEGGASSEVSESERFSQSSSMGGGGSGGKGSEIGGPLYLLSTSPPIQENTYPQHFQN